MPIYTLEDLAEIVASSTNPNAHDLRAMNVRLPQEITGLVLSDLLDRMFDAYFSTWGEATFESMEFGDYGSQYNALFLAFIDGLWKQTTIMLREGLGDASKALLLLEASKLDEAALERLGLTYPAQFSPCGFGPSPQANLEDTLMNVVGEIAIRRRGASMLVRYVKLG